MVTSDLPEKRSNYGSLRLVHDFPAGFAGRGA